MAHGDGVHYDRNVRQMKWTRRIGFFVLRLQMQQREFSRVFSVSKQFSLNYYIDYFPVFNV